MLNFLLDQGPTGVGKSVRSSMMIAVTVALLAGCATKKGSPQVAAPPPSPPPTPVVVTPPPVLPAIGPKERLINATTYLNRGEADTARVEIMAVLAERPNDAAANNLLRQIDGDPQKLLGSRSYAYRIRRGETLSDIAARTLGDRSRFFILARYNGIAVPQDAKTGQIIQVPGTEPVVPKPSVPARPAVATAGERTATPVAVAPVTNPAQANRLRQSGLAQMARGSIDQAVALLRRALSFDPGNSVILSDLDRALRVQRTVHGQ